MKDIRFALLVEGWLHDELDEASCRHLLELVRTDPQRMAFLHDQAHLHTMLAAQHAGADTGEALLQQVRAGLRRSAGSGRARHSLWPAMSIAAALLVAVGLWLLMSQAATTAAVELWRDGRSLSLADVGAWRRGDELRAQAADTVDLPDGSQAVLAAGSRLLWHGEDDGVALRLIAGAARFEVRSRAEPNFRVATAHVACRVLGTAFTLRTSASASQLDVHAGRVQVDAGRVIAAGQRSWYFDTAAVDAWLASLPRRSQALATLPTQLRPLVDVPGPWQVQETLAATHDGGRAVLAATQPALAVHPLPDGIVGDFVIRVTTTVLDDSASAPALRLSVHGLSFRRREPSVAPRIAGTTLQELRFLHRGRHHLVDWWEFEQRIDGVLALRGFAYGLPEAIALHLDQITVRVDEVAIATGDG